jgi:hypothetical protein
MQSEQGKTCGRKSRMLWITTGERRKVTRIEERVKQKVHITTSINKKKILKLYKGDRINLKDSTVFS